MTRVDERFYNGIHSELMDKIYDGLVARYGSIKELHEACPDWATLSLYLTRSVNVAKTALLKEILEKMPKKKEHEFDNEPYCRSCRRSETFCQCEGYNQALSDCEQAVRGVME